MTHIDLIIKLIAEDGGLSTPELITGAWDAALLDEGHPAQIAAVGDLVVSQAQMALTSMPMDAALYAVFMQGVWVAQQLAADGVPYDEAA